MSVSNNIQNGSNVFDASYYSRSNKPVDSENNSAKGLAAKTERNNDSNVSGIAGMVEVEITTDFRNPSNVSRNESIPKIIARQNKEMSTRTFSGKPGQAENEAAQFNKAAAFSGKPGVVDSGQAEASRSFSGRPGQAENEAAQFNRAAAFSGRPGTVDSGKTEASRSFSGRPGQAEKQAAQFNKAAAFSGRPGAVESDIAEPTRSFSGRPGQAENEAAQLAKASAFSGRPGVPESEVSELQKTKKLSKKTDSSVINTNMFINTYDRESRKNANVISEASPNPISVKEVGQQLKNLVNTLQATDGRSAFNKYEANVSDKSVVHINTDASKAGELEKLPTIAIKVESLAKAQVNSGGGVLANRKDITLGEKVFAIDVAKDKTKNARSQDISVNVSSTDTNESLQKKMAVAINNSRLGVMASINVSPKEGVSELIVTAASTGKRAVDGDYTFSIADKKGDLAEKMGITNVSQVPQDAKYAINGESSKQSQTNKIDLGYGITATLLQDGKSASVDFSRDITGSLNVVGKTVDTLNSVIEGTSIGISTPMGRANRLAENIYNMNLAYSPTLGKVGISMQSDGRLKIDSEQIKKSAEDGSLEKVFAAKSGYAERIKEMANQLEKASYYSAMTVQSQKSNFGMPFTK